MHGAARVKTSGKLRPIYVAGALVVVSVVAFQWFQPSHRAKATARALPDETAEPEVPVESPPPVTARPRADLPVHVKQVAAVASIQAVTRPPDAEFSAEERKRERQGRFDHIQSIFQAQSAKDFDPVRAQKLERALAPVLAEAARAGRVRLRGAERRGRAVE